jgi:hypothetical protein
MRDVWDLAPCILVEEAFCLHHQSDERQNAHLQRRSAPTRLHCAVSQKALIVLLEAVRT